MVHMGPTHPKDLRCKFRFAVLTTIYDRPRREQEHGLRPLPTADYPDLKAGVTFKCTKKQEAVSD